MSGTSSSQSQDEFADLPDIVDFSLIRPEDYADNSATHSLDEFAEYDLYNEHDPYADLDLNTVPGLGAPTPQTAEQDHARMQPENQNQVLSDSSSQYLFDEPNEVALTESNNIEELNHIEMRDRGETSCQ
ncbi:hypothetical protein OH76DRAFT_600273 [Lentinus brumalis]|uniref:Uncharacterized protein n=1 Tax=Lentinus brumalis TaxID=2498619 RepID=A0A371DUD9_9APHY|nr:hypothetical protein OH76DRAFT_600273 [Polyporus brumalis]